MFFSGERETAHRASQISPLSLSKTGVSLWWIRCECFSDVRIWKLYSMDKSSLFLPAGHSRSGIRLRWLPQGDLSRQKEQYQKRKHNLYAALLPVNDHKEKAGWRYIKEIFAVVIDDIQTVICIACQSVGHGYASLGLGIVTVSNIHCRLDWAKETFYIFHLSFIQWWYWYVQTRNWFQQHVLNDDSSL